MNSWLMGSLADQHLMQSMQGASDEAAETMKQIQLAKLEETELEDLEGADWQADFKLRRHYARRQVPIRLFPAFRIRVPGCLF